MDDKLLKWFTGDFMTKLSHEVELFYLKCIREPCETLLNGGRKSVPEDRDNPDDPNFQSSVYYVGGSTVRSVRARAMRSTNDPTWKKIVVCINDRMIVGEGVNAPDSSVTNWLRSRDRGGLLHITEPMWTSLMALTGILVKVEEIDGSVPQSKVLDCVCSEQMICILSSNVISDKLRNEAVSYTHLTLPTKRIV